MPRAMRDTPIAMPIGIAVTQASEKAANTRNIDQRSARPAARPSARPPPIRTKLLEHAFGRRQEQRRHPAQWVASHHSANSATTVTTLISVLEPSPGIANRDVRAVACFAAAGARQHRRRLSSFGRRRAACGSWDLARCDTSHRPARNRARRPAGLASRGRSCGGLAGSRCWITASTSSRMRMNSGRRLHRARVARTR